MARIRSARARKVHAKHALARRKRKHAHAKPTQAIVVAPAQEVSVIPKVEQTIQNLERVRHFVVQALNRDLVREMKKLDGRKDLKPDERSKAELALRDRLEIDWGTIPGIEKPFLKQPGAEKFLLWLNLYPKYTKHEREMPDGHLEMVCSVSVYAKKTHELVFEGPDCSCTTMENNFRYLWAETVKPPDDIADTLKAQKMGRNRKVTKWVKGNRIEQWVWEQRVENPNPWNSRNTVRQIGEKRALVKCIRNLGAISELFTADPSEWEEPPADASPEDEMDYTAGGRKIYEANGVSPSGRYQDTRRPAKEARGPAVEARPSPEPPKSSVAPPKEKKNGKIIVTWPNPPDGVAMVSGDLARILPVVQEAMVCQWLESKKGYAVPGTEVCTLHDIVLARGYEYEEVSAAPVASPCATPPKEAAAEKPARTTEPRDTSAAPLPAVPSAGVIKSAKPGKTGRTGAQYMDVTIGGYTYNCYNKDLHGFFSAGVGQEAEVILDKRRQIVGIVRIGKRKFSEGKYPEIDVNEPRTSATKDLFS
jgi:hypothetical protein